MASQVSRKFAFAKQALLGLLPQLEEDLGDAAVADELAQTFSVALEMVHSSAAEATLDVAADSEVAALVAVARDRLLPYATASWLEHSPHLVAEEEEPRSSSVAAAPPAPLDVPGGYTRLAEYRLQVEAGTMSRADFEAHRSAILLSDPGLGLPSSLAVSSPLLRLSMEPTPAGGSGSPAADLTELFSNQSLQSPALRAVTAAPSPSEGAAAPSEAAAASRASGSRSRSRRLTAEPVPDADSAPRRGVKRGRNPPLMNVSQIPGYVRCVLCVQRKVKCAPFLGTGPPYPCSHCISSGRECIRPAGGRARGRPAMGPSGDPATEGLRLLASAFFGPEVASSGVALAVTIMFWRAEVARVLAARRALDVQLSFAEWQCSHFLGGLIEPGPSSTLPPRKRARTGTSGKGKEKAADAGALSDEVEIVEPMDEAQDGADEAVWAGRVRAVVRASYIAQYARVLKYTCRVCRLCDRMVSAFSAFSAFLSRQKILAVLSYRVDAALMPSPVNGTTADGPAEGADQRPPTSAGEDHRAHMRAVTQLARLAERWYDLRTRPDDVAQFLRDFYQAWDHAEQTAVRIGMSGLNASARGLRTTLEEAAAPYAELDWLLLFPGVFEEHRSWLIRYAAVFNRAQSTVIANVVFGPNIAALRNPYILAIAEFRDMHVDGFIDLDEFQWHEEQLGRAGLLTEIRRRRSSATEAASTNSGFFFIGNTWDRCPRQAPQIISWLRLFQGAWDYLRLMADMANNGDMGADAYALRTRVRNEAAPYADVNWLLEFPMITEHVRNRVLVYTGVLCRTQRTVLEQCLEGSLVREQVPDIYDRAAIGFDELRSSGEMSREEYHWHISKLRADRLMVGRDREPLEKKVKVVAVPRPALCSCSACVEGSATAAEDEICESQRAWYIRSIVDIPNSSEMWGRLGPTSKRGAAIVADFKTFGNLERLPSATVVAAIVADIKTRHSGTSSGSRVHRWLRPSWPSSKHGAAIVADFKTFGNLEWLPSASVVAAIVADIKTRHSGTSSGSRVHRWLRPSWPSSKRGAAIVADFKTFGNLEWLPSATVVAAIVADIKTRHSGTSSGSRVHRWLWPSWPSSKRGAAIVADFKTFGNLEWLPSASVVAAIVADIKNAVRPS
ncbi:hypothetical protein EDB84DRAFT_1439407 [Lactarius hengduanensis]|nr:hypothetical protein EDB84DRAFT_1439407 [Lactarius hengduanensis]